MHAEEWQPEGSWISDAAFAGFRELILRTSGIALSPTKRQLVCSRLARRLRHHGYSSFERYLEHLLQADPDRRELQEMINCITTNKTDFFRESHHFEFLRDRVLRPGEHGPLRIWSAGCSSGEEPYSIAIAAHEALGADAGRLTIEASDIDTDILARAAAGVYPEDRLDGVPLALRPRYFVRRSDGTQWRYKVKPAVRELIRFSRINLTGPHWPVTPGLDVIFCRNVIIYFNRESQEQLLRRFARLLRPGGHLILGHSENLHWLADQFTPLGETVYRLKSGGAAPRPAAPERRRIIVGEWFAGRTPTVVSTLLGSCVAACLYDPVARIGGMNHFLLPAGVSDHGLPTRYGVHAMEVLVNEILKLGGDRRRLVAKVFGGARVLDLTRDAYSVSFENSRFILEFLQTEGIPIAAQRLGGTEALEVRFEVHTGQARVRPVGPERAACAVADEERRHLQLLTGGAAAAQTPPMIF